MKRLLRPKWILLGVAGLLVAGFGAFSVLVGGPRNVYGLVRFALPQMHRGELRLGDAALDFRMTALDGHSSFSLRERIGQRPLVLIFGSYT